MNDQTNSRDENLSLAEWLQQVLAITPSQAGTFASISEKNQSAGGYHLEFYQQLPDFVMALLNNDSQATIYYAPLLFHLIGCPTCHSAYLEIYDAMRAAVHTDETSLPVYAGQTTSSWATIPPREVEHLCKVLINQAEAVLLQGRREGGNSDAVARSLLQQAILISKHIMQNDARQQALRDLVRVALLSQDAMRSIQEGGPAIHSYSSLVGSGSSQRHPTRRRSEAALHPAGESVIHLQSGSLKGNVLQVEDMLELQLEDLDEKLRGLYLSIFIPLGSLIEPVHWIGGNPYDIRSQAPVDEQGRLRTPLGKTDLQLTNREDHNLLEAMFKRLDVRPAS